LQPQGWSPGPFLATGIIVQLALFTILLLRFVRTRSHEERRWAPALILGGADGGTPYTGVILGPEEQLYGVTAFGGQANVGVVFEIKP
jgi:hypothetical protein